jgi:acetate kinase
MTILALNAGSATLKFQLIYTPAGPGAAGHERRLARGAAARIGGRASLSVSGPDGRTREEQASLSDHGAAARAVLDRLRSMGTGGSVCIDAVGHRIVHGGDRFSGPTLIDGEVLDALGALSSLDPLHVRPALRALHAARAALGPDVAMVAVFDTAFHRTLPARAAEYAIPHTLAARHGIRRYGFHGLAHRSMVEPYAALTRTPPDRVRVVTLQLGSGCSAAAIRGGRSVDTSMGMTPLEGLMMGTRSGDLDPSLVGLLARRERVPVDTVEAWLNERSGLLGVSGRASTCRTCWTPSGGGTPGRAWPWRCSATGSGSTSAPTSPPSAVQMRSSSGAASASMPHRCALASAPAWSGAVSPSTRRSTRRPWVRKAGSACPHPSSTRA